MQALAEPVRIPGTNVSLQPPAGFERSESFPGFQSAEQQASIMVTQMPAPVAEVMKGMNKETLATRGMTLLSSNPETAGGRDALLLQVAQAAGGAEYLKWMLVTGDPKSTVLVVGTFPKSAGEEVGAAIRTSLLTMGGLKAWELLADAKDVKSGTPIRLYQVIAPDEGGGYFIVQGLVGMDRAAEILPELRRVTASFRRTDG